MSGKNSNFSDAKFFPKNYYDSRERFAALVSRIPGAETESWQIPSKTDKDLFTDSAYWPPLKQPEFLWVITSGIHGSETYAGSAILQMFLSEIMPKIDRSQTGVWLVHAMNPYGFKHHQRTTENGVNLNRNFSISGELYKSRNVDSEKMHERFFAREVVSSPKSKLMSQLQVKDGIAFFGDVTMDQFTKATAPGQFVTPQDVEFGGKNLEPQSQLFVEKLKKLMPLYRDVVALDLHTGLGDENRLHLLTSGSGKDLNPELFAKLFDAKADKEYYEYTPASADGFYEVHGALNCAFADLVKPEQRICAITMEFGTLGHSLEAQLKGLNNFLVEHQGRFNGYANDVLKTEIEKECFERSYPQRDEWRSAVVNASRGMFREIARRGGFLKD
jgi:predicted deacylase